LPTSISNGGPRDYAYAYVPRAESAPYWAMAEQFVLADHMFPTEFGPSFTAHFEFDRRKYRHQGGADCRSRCPNRITWGCEAPPGTRSFTLDVHRVERFNGPFPCFNHFATLADVLDAAGVSWKYYAAPLNRIGGKVWSEFSAIRAVRYGPDWKNVISPQTRILDDVPGGTLAGVSWVTPDWKDSDHTGSGYNDGRRGSLRSSTRSEKARIGTRRRSWYSGTIGAAGTITCRASARFSRLGHSRRVHHHLTVRADCAGR